MEILDNFSLVQQKNQQFLKIIQESRFSRQSKRFAGKQILMSCSDNFSQIMTFFFFWIMLNSFRNLASVQDAFCLCWLKIHIRSIIIKPYSTSFGINYMLKKMHSEHKQVLWQNINPDKSVFCSRLSFMKCLMQQSDYLNSLLLKLIWSQTTQTTGVLDMQGLKCRRAKTADGITECTFTFTECIIFIFFFHFVLQRQEEKQFRFSRVLPFQQQLSMDSNNEFISSVAQISSHFLD